MLTRPAATRDAGFTLVELLVGIGLFALVGTLVASLTISSLAETRRGQDFGGRTSQTGNAMNVLGREIAVAKTVTTAAPTEFVMDTTRGTACLRFRFYVSTDANGLWLRQQTQTYKGAGDNCPAVGSPANSTTDRPLVPVEPSAGLFTYFGAPHATGLLGTSAAVPGDVQRVDVLLTVRRTEARQPQVQQTTIRLRNALLGEETP